MLGVGKNGGAGPSVNGQPGSYVVGHGDHYPTTPHHASSYCPPSPKFCGWGDWFNNKKPNHWTLYGALIGGPKTAVDNIDNDRNDYVTNEVSLDYNCGFTGLLAAMMSDEQEPPTTLEPPTTTLEPPTTRAPATTTPDPADCSAGTGKPPRNPENSQVNADDLSNGPDYKNALTKSLLFYDSQMSGKLPSWNGVPWRGDSGLRDGCEAGYDLTGGFYDAGDFIKFHFPQSFALTVLGWGMIEFKDGYVAAGEWEHIQNLFKWGVDHFKKCHAKDHPLYPNIFFGQVGHGETDHSVIGRPEEMTMWRPAYEISSQKPGSELAAGAAVVFAIGAYHNARENGNSDPEAVELLKRAKELLAFAVNYKVRSFH